MTLPVIFPESHSDAARLSSSNTCRSAAASQLPFVDKHHGTVRSSRPVGEAQALVQMAGRKVRFVDANVHAVRAPLAGLAESCLHQRSPQALCPPGRSDIEFREVTLLASAPAKIGR